MSDVKMWRYNLCPFGDAMFEGWAEIVLTSTGMFAAVSDYGNYAYSWRFHGEVDFRTFVAQLANEPDYFKRKVGHRVYDGKATIAEVKRTIIAYRREYGWSPERARSEWNLLWQYNNLETREDFAQWYNDTHIDDAGELCVMGYDSDLTMFAELVLPRLRDAINAELEAERRVA